MMAKRRTRKGATRKVARAAWGYALKPTGVGFWRYIVKPAATGTGRAGKWTWAYAWDPDARARAKNTFADRFNGDGKWARTATPKKKRRRKARRGTFHCRRCGLTARYVAGTGSAHDCVEIEPTQPRHPGYHDKPPAPKTKKKAKAATGPATPPPPPRRKVRPLPPVANPTRGARIVRAGTAAERFAFLATADPGDTEEFEAMLHNLRMGVLRLSQEIYDFAENTDVDKKVKAKINKLADATADLAEPARDIRTTFRAVYKDYLAALEAGVTAPFTSNSA